jgi:serine/threonine protein phosphatase PrpC
VEGVRGQGRCKFFILASDGLWDILDNETAVRVVNE